MRQFQWFLVLDLAANFAWEMAQMPLYATRMSVGRCMAAAGGDLVLTLAALALGGILARGRRPMFWALTVVLLTSAAVLIEALALSVGRWAYAVTMPTLLGIGLPPLLQLPLIGLASVWLATRVSVPVAAGPIQ